MQRPRRSGTPQQRRQSSEWDHRTHHLPLTSSSDVANALALLHAKIALHLMSHAALARACWGTGSHRAGLGELSQEGLCLIRPSSPASTTSLALPNCPMATPQTAGQSRCCTRDGSHEGVQTRKSVGGDGDLQGLVVDVLKADLAMAASKEPSVEVEIGAISSPGRKGASKSWTRSGRGKEFYWWRLRSVSRDQWTSNRGAWRPLTLFRVRSDRAPTNGQFVAVRARCFGERVGPFTQL